MDGRNPCQDKDGDLYVGEDKRRSIKMKKRGGKKLWWMWLSTGTDWPESWWNLCPWRFSRLSRARPQISWFNLGGQPACWQGQTGWPLEVTSSLSLPVIFLNQHNQTVTFSRGKLSSSADSLSACFISLAPNVVPQLCQISKISIPLHAKLALFVCHNYFHFPP